MTKRTYVITSGADMQKLGADFAAELSAGSVVSLTGDLGAGKTTFTQGIGKALGVRGRITSPTFVISRVHGARTGTSGGLGLVHMDAYRLSGPEEFDDLGIDELLRTHVVVVEWGEEIVGSWVDSYWQVTIDRDLPGMDPDERRVTIYRVTAGEE